MLTTAQARPTHSHSHPNHTPIIYLRPFEEPLEGAQEGINIRKHSPVRGSRACSWRNAWDSLERSRSGWFPSILPPEVCIGSLAHPYRTPDNEQWRGPLAIRVQALDSPTETSCCLTLILLHACNILCMCWHYYYYYSIIIIIIIIIITFTSPHLTFCHQFPPFLCIKMPASLCNIIFLTDEDPGLGRNVWIKWPRHRPVKFFG